MLILVFLLSVIGFYFINRTRRENQLLLKRNISLLREEKIISAVEPSRTKKRRKLLRRIKSNNEMNEHEVLSEAQKNKLSAGEILLANKINSFSN
jgi:siroheme synthase (precorrin-2 oxidase/ferrochelatase)